MNYIKQLTKTTGVWI